MKKLILVIALPLILASCAVNRTVPFAGYTYDVEQRIRDRGITLSTPTPPTAAFVRTVRSGNLIFLSGHGPDKPDGTQVTGKVGAEITVEQGQEAARLVGISLLNSFKAEIGNLNKVRRIVKVTGMVNCVPTFTQHSVVINGFSNLMVDIFGDNGKHARSSIGMSSLPNNISVEIEMIVEVAD
jgi:enamine deaminase RidA (YjgF/YER057c/UK114 family)